MDYLGETGDVNYTAMVEALSKDYLDWYILTQVCRAVVEVHEPQGRNTTADKQRLSSPRVPRP